MKTKLDYILLDNLKRSGNWFVRTDTNEKSYGDFQVAPNGKWNKCPKWGEQTKADCTSGGFFGQAPDGWGYAHPGNRFTFCQTRGKRIIVAADKVKVPEFMVLYEDQEAYDALEYVCPDFRGSLPICARSGIFLTLPALKEAGYVRVNQGATLTLPALEKAGDVRVNQGATLTLPALEKAGDVWVNQGAKIDAPKLKPGPLRT
ncbi:MAG: hypothetical protein UY28_C0004G0014 [Candidatus Amesbacteria bacterium GW2011_GWB1_48_13]|uniref:Uncharacterized protein n=1 Tax=Candidatus Amesbacteria bacterium GW2011_GWB1_48_13 TaxID=1618362 RepID=A0A0G1UW47_9BACT|nr:MAG: hypothetical protein UY28_C0004G0014 [Candidatus Amesbacteria bacterium GW2011_GWB1_48_13]